MTQTYLILARIHLRLMLQMKSGFSSGHSSRCVQSWNLHWYLIQYFNSASIFLKDVAFPYSCPVESRCIGQTVRSKCISTVRTAILRTVVQDEVNSRTFRYWRIRLSVCPRHNKKIKVFCDTP
jgi:hypothetical protein